MVTTDVFDKLRELQDILAEKNELEQQIFEAPKLLVAQEELLTRYKEGFIKKNAEYEEVRKAIGALKADLFETEQRREAAEAAMDNISTQREYDALDKEIQEATKQEEKIRAEMVKLDTRYKKLDEEIKLDQNEIAHQEKELEENKAVIDTNIQKKRDKIKQLEEEEKQLSPDLDGDTLFKFERIIKSKQGVGIVPVQGNICSGCHMILPAQFAIEVHKGKSIMYCPYCSRILYYQETTGPETAFFDEEDMGGLVDLVDEDTNDTVSDNFDDD
ncbi:zinc ribbon domain-containing protein [Treponema phagedenis]|uniref:zinc ribbon domain-containing protein n=1 Tax=Treponema phagedenis TaxID=162 RepID=UPI00046671C0|nr:zinc ribbon domain-containing protein [Treponema phagedenis]NVP24758.1 nucleic acid-binding protein [Treponema phagedenis]QEJ95870.1 nucleic acid-binding protein [Treponema phagedenis]QEK05445.1 nucleic acid-binding protein [Treponema phagedenis]QKS93068.1 nucleic acid-binding protein [Treponema phagedenis]QLC58945.1 nucleic acid-binding protein [Treponema phagedenis]